MSDLTAAIKAAAEALAKAADEAEGLNGHGSGFTEEQLVADATMNTLGAIAASLIAYLRFTAVMTLAAQEEVEKRMRWADEMAAHVESLDTPEGQP